MLSRTHSAFAHWTGREAGQLLKVGAAMHSSEDKAQRPFEHRYGRYGGHTFLSGVLTESDVPDCVHKLPGVVAVRLVVVTLPVKPQLLSAHRNEHWCVKQKEL